MYWNWRKVTYSFLRSAVTCFGVIVVIFLLQSMYNNQVSRLISGRHSDAEQLKRIDEELGLNEPAWRQFGNFFADLSPVNVAVSQAQVDKWSVIWSVGENREFILKWPYLGRSYVNRNKVSTIILEGLPETLVLAFTAILFAALIGVPLGMVSAYRPGSWIDKFTSIVSSTGMAIPSFLAAILVGWFLGYQLHDLTGLSMTGSLFTYNVYEGREVLTLHNLLLPAFTLAIRPISVVSQLMRDSLVEVNKSDYIRTAYAKGLTPLLVMTRHAFRNAMTPVVTLLATSFAGLMSGSVFVEYVFDWKGLGHVLFNAIEYNDFPIVTGMTLCVSITFILINWLLTFVYPIINPVLRQ